MNHFATGVMSGTSLDGMDIAHCCFELRDGKWHYDILAAETIDYSDHWREKLRTAPKLDARTCHALHMEYGHYIGTTVKRFLDNNQIRHNELIASHGHTVFHQPHEGYTLQIGHGAAIAASAKCDTVSDFRSMDVALGGQGAPLVPIGDKHLFAGYDACLNLGGFSNISMDRHGKRIAFDVCPFNFVINKLVRREQIITKNILPNHKSQHPRNYLEYDPEGMIARSGKKNQELLGRLNSIAYYHQPPPKSLGEEWVRQHMEPLLEESNLSLPDLLHTYYHHAAMQVAGAAASKLNRKLLITGGGACNAFFIECLRAQLPDNTHIHVPDRQTVDFKEALVFAFLGLLCSKRQINCLSSVTGAIHDAVGGSLHYFPQ